MTGVQTCALPISTTRIYRADEDLDPYHGVALHTVTVCELARPEMDCSSTAVLGAPGRVFYVSGDSVYVWTTPWRRVRALDAVRDVQGSTGSP